ncbi:basic proline-rich protein-like [Neovison vison]|uniref:basic proline-rich protein-like n=1 Tax=Neovison vison TaxID=452646 RepID=UPI001CF01A70|nr:basic proline-rich protein-like [Neogale vison]
MAAGVAPPRLPPPTFAALEWPRSPPRCCPLPRSACLCSRNSAPGPRRCRWAWLRSAPPPCAASRAPPVGTWTGARAPAAGRAPVTHPPDHPAPGRRGPPPPDRPPGLQRAARTPALPPPSTAVPRAPSTAWGPSDVGSATKCLIRPRPLDSDSSSSPPTASPAPEGRAGLSPAAGPVAPSSQRPLLLLPDGGQVPGVPGSQLQPLVFFLPWTWSFCPEPSSLLSSQLSL